MTVTVTVTVTVTAREMNILLSCLVTITLLWDAPLTNSDGTPLKDLKGYKIYSAIADSGVYTSVDTKSLATTYTTTITDVTFFKATAYDTSDNESQFSNKVFVDCKVYDFLSKLKVSLGKSVNSLDDAEKIISGMTR